MPFKHIPSAAPAQGEWVYSSGVEAKPSPLPISIQKLGGEAVAQVTEVVEPSESN